MNFTMIGSLSSYTKNLKLQTQWNIKKASGNMTAPDNQSLEEMTEKERIGAIYQQGIKGQNGSDKDKLEQILNKMYAGEKLTEEEKAFIKEKAPEDYQRYVEAQQNQKSYEQDIKRCKTKEDVARLKMQYANTSLMRIKSIENNANISEEKKLKICKLENLKHIKIEEITSKFVESGEFERLPTDAEKAKVEKEEREAKEMEFTGIKRNETEHTEKKEQTEDREVVKEVEESQEEVKAVQVENDPATSTVKTDREIESHEARKVHRAKARAAYAAIVHQEDASEISKVNVKI